MVGNGTRFEKSILLTFILVVFLVLSGCSPGQSIQPAKQTPSVNPVATVTPKPPMASSGGNMDWNQVCLDATIRAIDMEIAKYNMWLKNANGSNKEMYQKALKYLQAEQQKYRKMKPEDYKIGSAFRYIPGVTIGAYGRGKFDSTPKPVLLEEAWARSLLPGIIDYKGMSRSGPFYVVVGVKGGDFGAIKPGTHYKMKLQPIMPESYPFPSFYVCVESFEKVK